MIIAVTAWRHWTDVRFIEDILWKWHRDRGGSIHVRVGDAQGGDEIVRNWCQRINVSHKVFYADWKTHGSHQGSPAGPIRNHQMLAGIGDQMAGQAHVLLAFPGRKRPIRVPGSGSWGCCIEAAILGIQVVIPAYKEVKGAS
jgi:hypothetical protein